MCQTYKPDYDDIEAEIPTAPGALHIIEVEDRLKSDIYVSNTRLLASMLLKPCCHSSVGKMSSGYNIIMVNENLMVPWED